MKKIALLIVAFGVLVAVALSLLSGLAVYSGRQQSALLVQPPQHGTSIVIAADLSPADGETNVMATLRETIQRRFYRFGTRIYWEALPGSRIHIATPITDPNQFEALRSLISQGGHLEFRLVHEKSDQLVTNGDDVPAGYQLLKHSETQSSGQAQIETVVAKMKPETGLAGDIIKSARVMHDPMGQPEIYFELRPESAITFAGVTRTNIDHRLAIILDGQLYSAPVIKSPIETGECEIAGHFDDREARLLVNLMEHPLPVQVKLVDFKTF